MDASWSTNGFTAKARGKCRAKGAKNDVGQDHGINQNHGLLGKRLRNLGVPTDFQVRGVNRGNDRPVTAVDGSAWGAVVPITDQWQEVDVPLASLRPTTLVLLPRPYPEFLPNEWRPAEAGSASRAVSLSNVDGVQVPIGANLYGPGTAERAHGFELERIIIE